MAAEQHKIAWQVLLRGIKLGGVALGLFYFICLMLMDNWSALKSKPRTWWIPGKALILSALSIQVLSYLDYSNIRFSDVPDKKGVADLLANQLMIDSGRLVICVFIGYLLPGMATRGSAEASSDIVALVVSLFTAITSELFYVYKAGKPSKEEGGYNYLNDFLSEFSHDSKKAWFIVSSSIFLLAIVLLILFLVSAILAGKTARCLLKQRINSALSTFSKAEECWEKFDDEVFKSWLLCRAGQPQYVIARSVLSSSTGLVVTVCIVLFLAKAVNSQSGILHLHDELDFLRHIIFVLQCVFLLLGGWVIFRRWFMAVIYFPIFFRRDIECPPLPRCSVEDFWTRSILELINMYDLQDWRRQKKSADAETGIFMKMFTKLKLHKFLYFLWALQKLLVWFSKCCWLFSEMLFGSMVMRRALIGNSRSLFYEVDPSVDYQAFVRYKEALEHVCMPGETPASLWLTNKDSVVQAKDRIEEGKKMGLKCQELIQLLRKRSERAHDVERFVLKPDEDLPLVKLVKDYFPAMNESWWKMAAVSLLRIIFKLQGDDQKKEEAINAYKQAWDLMSFVESSSTEQPNSIDVTQVFDFEADLVSMVADNEFKKFEGMHEASTTNDGRNVSQELLKAAKKQLRDHKLLQVGETGQDVERADGLSYEGPQDSKDWNEILPSYSMYRVCKRLESRDPINIEELQICLTDVIADFLEQLPSILVRSFKEWTLEHQEDMMWEAFYIVGKYKQVVQECALKPKWKTAEPKVPEPTEVQNN